MCGFWQAKLEAELELAKERMEQFRGQRNQLLGAYDNSLADVGEEIEEFAARMSAQVSSVAQIVRGLVYMSLSHV